MQPLPMPRLRHANRCRGSRTPLHHGPGASRQLCVCGDGTPQRGRGRSRAKCRAGYRSNESAAGTARPPSLRPERRRMQSPRCGRPDGLIAVLRHCRIPYGVTFDSVSPGVSSHPVTTAGPDPVQRGRSEAVADGSWTVGVTEIKPSRNTVRVALSIEDAARIPGLEGALRRDMRMAVTEKIDRTIFWVTTARTKTRPTLPD